MEFHNCTHLWNSINDLWNSVNDLWNSVNDLWNSINDLWNSINAYFRALRLAIPTGNVTGYCETKMSSQSMTGYDTFQISAMGSLYGTPQWSAPAPVAIPGLLSAFSTLVPHSHGNTLPHEEYQQGFWMQAPQWNTFHGIHLKSFEEKDELIMTLEVKIDEANKEINILNSTPCWNCYKLNELHDCDPVRSLIRHLSAPD